jgi:hypothetical protein
MVRALWMRRSSLREMDPVVQIEVDKSRRAARRPESARPHERHGGVDGERHHNSFAPPASEPIGRRAALSLSRTRHRSCRRTGLGAALVRALVCCERLVVAMGPLSLLPAPKCKSLDLSGPGITARDGSDHCHRRSPLLPVTDLAVLPVPDR